VNKLHSIHLRFWQKIEKNLPLDKVEVSKKVSPFYGLCKAFSYVCVRSFKNFSHDLICFIINRLKDYTFNINL